MREIKFRAWNGEDMLNIDHWTLSMVNKHIPDNHIIMQYTGLYDKKHKEVYEGDILDSYGGAKYIVFWNRGEYMTKRIGKIPTKNMIPVAKTLSPLTHWNLMQFEVIGNIHENPELLERKCYEC